MAEHKMVIIDGIRYRPEDAPHHHAVAEPDRPKRAPRSTTKKDDGDRPESGSVVEAK